MEWEGKLTPEGRVTEANQAETLVQF